MNVFINRFTYLKLIGSSLAFLAGFSCPDDTAAIARLALLLVSATGSLLAGLLLDLVDFFLPSSSELSLLTELGADSGIERFLKFTHHSHTCSTIWPIFVVSVF